MYTVIRENVYGRLTGFPASREATSPLYLRYFVAQYCRLKVRCCRSALRIMNTTGEFCLPNSGLNPHSCHHLGLLYFYVFFHEYIHFFAFHCTLLMWFLLYVVTPRWYFICFVNLLYMKDFTIAITYKQLIFNPTMPRIFYRYFKYVLFFY